MKNIEGCLSSYPLYLEKNMLLKLGRSRRILIESKLYEVTILLEINSSLTDRNNLADLQK